MSTPVSFSVYRRGVRSGQGQKRYTIELRLPDGTKSTRIGFTDKAATLQLAARLVREIERKEVGLVDLLAGSRRTPLAEHLETFLRAMKQGTLGRRRHGGACSDEWIARSRHRLLAMFASMGATRIEHLQQVEAERVLAERCATGWSAKTRDDHASLLRQFGAWLHDGQMAHANPFARVRPTRDAASRTFRRHALTVAELGRLVEAADTRPVQNYTRVVPWASADGAREAIRAQGWERGVLYQVAAFTGLRRGEVLALQWGDLLLGATPAIAVRAETTKNRRAARLELPRWLGGLLEQLRARRTADIGGVPGARSRVFEASYRHITERMQLDAEWAKIGTWQTVRGKLRLCTEDGRVVDFHALRGTLATLAAELGMPPRILQDLMRHSDVRLTMEVYAQVRSDAMRAAIEALPNPVSAPVRVDPRRTLADIGTDRQSDDPDRRAAT